MVAPLRRADDDEVFSSFARYGVQWIELIGKGRLIAIFGTKKGEKSS